MSAFGPYPAEILKIHDGDTCTVRLDLGFSIEFTASCRFFGINAPELSTQEGKDARDFLETVLAIGETVSVMSYGWDKYGGRFDGVITKADHTVVNDLMVSSGHAVPLNER